MIAKNSLLMRQDSESLPGLYEIKAKTNGTVWLLKYHIDLIIKNSDTCKINNYMKIQRL